MTFFFTVFFLSMIHTACVYQFDTLREEHILLQKEMNEIDELRKFDRYESVVRDCDLRYQICKLHGSMCQWKLEQCELQAYSYWCSVKIGGCTGKKKGKKDAYIRE